MPSEQDYRFADIVINRELAAREQLDECLSDLKLAEDIGAEVSLDVVMVRKGALTREQADEVLKEVEKRPKHVDRIAGYHIKKRIGTGGMGSVYKALQVSMERVVALKVLSPRLARNENYVKRFMHEARAVAKLSHVNIVQGYDFGVDEGYYYFAMEYVDGDSVRRLLKRDKRFDQARSVDITMQIARALDHAWEAAGMVHCDIKPDNILITTDGVAKLADLGLAKLSTVDAGTGRPGYTMGTPDYISPEQAKGLKDIDIRADIYSLGATLYHMLTGEKPFSGESSKDVLLKHVSTDIPDPRLLRPDISQRLVDILSKMCSRKRDERYQTPVEVMNDLEGAGFVEVAPPARPNETAFQEVAPSPTPAPKAPTRPAVARRKRENSTLPMVAGIAAILIAGVLVALLMVMGNGTGKPRTPPPDNSGNPLVREDRRAETAYAEAEQFAKDNPANYRAIALRFDAVAEDYSASEWGRKARRRAEEVRRERRSRNRAALKKVTSEVTSLVKEKRFGEAFAALDKFSIEQPEQAEATDKLRAMVHDKAVEAFASDKQAAEELVNKKDYAAAEEIYSKALGYGVDAVEAEASECLERVESLRGAGEGAPDELKHLKALKKYVTVIKTTKELLAERAYDAALEQYDGLLDDDAASDVRDAIMADRKDVALVKNIWDNALAKLRKPGKEVAVRRRGALIKGMVASRGTRKKVVVKMPQGNAEIEIPIKDITPSSEVLELAGVGESARELLKRAIFFMAAGKDDNAASALRRAAEKGADVDQLKSRLQARRKLIAEVKTETKAEDLWRQAKAAMTAESFLDAHAALRKLRSEYHDTQVYDVHSEKVEKAFGQSTMVRVPEGPFRFTRDNVTRELPTYYIDRFEVTNEQYAAFLDDISRTGDHSHCSPDEPPRKDHRPKYWLDGRMPEGKERHPVVGIDWYDAYAYAAWAGKRLPIEEEWEKAVRGAEGRLFPWGDTWATGRFNGGAAVGDRFPETAPVGSFTEWASPYGVNDAIGNVWEFTETSDVVDGVKCYVVRGGSWREDDQGYFHATYRFGERPSTRGKTLGFRCCSDTLTLERVELEKTDEDK